MTETRIYVGLNDSVSKKQIFETEKYIRIMKEVCFAYHTPFSFYVTEGGYIHENGEYTQEISLVLTLIDADPGIIQEIARDLCAFFHQESVLITEGDVRAYYLKDPLKDDGYDSRKGAAPGNVERGALGN